jgi:aminobutyraldehyde dehydrogenase
VVAGARQSDEIVRREVFGPVVSVTRFKDTEQAIAWANDSDYGLAPLGPGRAANESTAG